MIDLAEDLLPPRRSRLEAVGSKPASRRSGVCREGGEASRPSWRPGAGSWKLTLSSWTATERRTLGGVLGFLAGLAALGPIAALGAAILGALAARFTESR